MQLLQVISEYFPPVDDSCGGTQVHLRDLAGELVEQGHEVEILAALRGSEELGEYVMDPSEWDGVPVMRIVNNFRDVERFEMMYASPKMDARFRAFLWDRSPDLVHFHHFTRLSTTLVEVCRERGLPTVLTLHDYWTVCLRGQRLHPETREICEVLDRERCVECLNPLWPTLLPLPEEAAIAGGEPEERDLLEERRGWYTLRRWEEHMKGVLRSIDLLLFPSSFHRDRFIDFGVDPERCQVVEHGLPTEWLRAEPRGAAPVKTIGFVGSVIPTKGVHVLVEAFHRLGRKDLTLAIHGQVHGFHGKDGYAESLVGRDGTKVELRGAYEYRDLPEILAGIDLLVVPSVWWETFCLTAREGALAGLPVVASRIGGIVDAIDAGIAEGFEPGDVEDLARVLERVLDDDDLRDGMTRKGHLVRDIADCARETAGLYADLVERKRHVS